MPLDVALSRLRWVDAEHEVQLICEHPNHLQPRLGDKLRCRSGGETAGGRTVMSHVQNGRFDAAFVAIGAHLSKCAYIPAGWRRRCSTRCRSSAAWKATSRRDSGRVVVYGGENRHRDGAGKALNDDIRLRRMCTPAAQ